MSAVGFGVKDGWPTLSLSVKGNVLNGSVAIRRPEPFFIRFREIKDICNLRWWCQKTKQFLIVTNYFLYFYLVHLELEVLSVMVTLYGTVLAMLHICGLGEWAVCEEWLENCFFYGDGILKTYIDVYSIFLPRQTIQQWASLYTEPWSVSGDHAQPLRICQPTILYFYCTNIVKLVENTIFKICNTPTERNPVGSCWNLYRESWPQCLFWIHYSIRFSKKLIQYFFISILSRSVYFKV